MNARRERIEEMLRYCCLIKKYEIQWMMREGKKVFVNEHQQPSMSSLWAYELFCCESQPSRSRSCPSSHKAFSPSSASETEPLTLSTPPDSSLSLYLLSFTTLILHFLLQPTTIHISIYIHTPFTIIIENQNERYLEC